MRATSFISQLVTQLTPSDTKRISLNGFIEKDEGRFLAVDLINAPTRLSINYPLKILLKIFLVNAVTFSRK